MSESLLSSAAAPAAPAAEPAATTAAPVAAAPAAATPAAPAEPSSSAPAAAAGEDPPAEGKPASGETAAEGAPEMYADFKLAEDAPLAPEVVAKIGDLAKGLNLKQDDAQKVVEAVDQAARAVLQSQTDAVKALHTDWENQAKADKEFGGEKLAENLARAKAAMTATATPQLQVLLEKSGLAHHPDVIRHFLRIAPAVLADKHIPGGTQPAGSAKSAEKVLYPDMA